MTQPTLPLPLLGAAPGTAPPSLFERLGEERLRRLLWTFYARVMDDPLLAPFFSAKLGPFPQAGWPLHIARLEGFWRAVTHGPGAYRGQPAQAHQGLGLEAAHFDRWLALWGAVLRETLPEAEAAALHILATRMRGNLERAAVSGPGGASPGDML